MVPDGDAKANGLVFIERLAAVGWVGRDAAAADFFAIGRAVGVGVVGVCGIDQFVLIEHDVVIGVCAEAREDFEGD